MSGPIVDVKCVDERLLVTAHKNVRHQDNWRRRLTRSLEVALDAELSNRNSSADIALEKGHYHGDTPWEDLTARDLNAALAKLPDTAVLDIQDAPEPFVVHVLLCQPATTSDLDSLRAVENVLHVTTLPGIPYNSHHVVALISKWPARQLGAFVRIGLRFVRSVRVDYP